MKKNNQLRNLIIIFTILLIAILVSTWFQHIRTKIAVGYPLDKIPMKVDGWEGFNLTASEKESEWIGQGDLIIRTYKKGADHIYMVAIQEKGDRHKVHSPADCYSGSGWIVHKKDTVSLDANKEKKVRRMQVEKDNIHRIVYYWFTNGSRQCVSFKGHLVLFLKDVIFKGSIKSWVCFQISTDLKESSEDTEKILKDFIFELGV